MSIPRYIGALLLISAVHSVHSMDAKLVEIPEQLEVPEQSVPEEARAAFFAAVEEGDLKKVAQFLDDKVVDPNVQDDMGYSALHRAVMDGHEKLVKLLVRKGASVNAEVVSATEDGAPLHWASRGGNYGIAKQLVALGADVNQASRRSGSYPLHIVTQGDYRNLVQFFLMRGAAINARNARGDTALHTAVTGKKRQLFSLLVEEGADMRQANERGYMPLHCAFKEGQKEMVDLVLAEDDDIGLRTAPGGLTPLHIAACCGHEELVAYLMSKGAALEAQTDVGLTPLEYVIKKGGHLSTAGILLDAGAQVDGQKLLAMTIEASEAYAVGAGFKQEFIEFVKRISENCLDEKNAQGDTPLLSALKSDKRIMSELLIALGADVNCADKDGNTPLLIVAQKKYSETLRIVGRKLIENGAAVESVNNEGNTALMLAAARGYSGLCLSLISGGALIDKKSPSGDTALLLAATHGHARTVATCCDANAQLDEVNDAGDTALISAARAGHVAICETLIQKGADVSIKNKKGLTALSEAAEQGHSRICKLLLQNVATLGNGAERFLLHQAVREDDLVFVYLLVTRGTPLNVKNHDGLTPYKCALKADRESCIGIFREAFKEYRNKIRKAIQQGALQQVRQLLESCEECVYCFDDEPSVLIDAIDTMPEAIPVLIEHGADMRALVSLDGSGLWLRGQLIRYAADGSGLWLRGQLIHYAAKEGKADAVTFLIDAGVSKDPRDVNGNTPLHWAAREGHLRVVELLLGEEASIVLENRDGNTPLFEAVSGGHTDCIYRLLFEGADLQKTNDAGDTVLYNVLSGGRVERALVQYLINNGSDSNAQNLKGRTPLHCAVVRGDKDLVVQLLNAGGSLNCRTKTGMTVCELAKRMRPNKQVIDYLEALVENYAKKLQEAVDTQNCAAIQKILDACIDCIDEYNDEGHTVLYEAVKNKYREVVACLVKNNAAINKATRDTEWTPLHVAAYNGDVATMNALFEGKPEVNMLDAQGRTPLHIAMQHGQIDIVTLLISNGADGSLRDAQNKTPLEYAQRGRDCIFCTCAEIIDNSQADNEDENSE